MTESSQTNETVRLQTTIEISDLSRVLASSIKRKLESSIPSNSGTKCCIYRVHEKFRKINEYAYTPEMISIGPFHHGEGNLLAMEKHKHSYTRDLLSRTTNTEWSIVLGQCIEHIRKIEQEARDCYSEPINLEREIFIEMLVIDGLFIIELFLRNSRNDEKSSKNDREVDTEKDDPIFSNVWSLPSLVRDLVLLENQLPMIVLRRLFELLVKYGNIKKRSLTKLALHFFNPLMPRDKEVRKKYSSSDGKHLLDLLGKTFHDLPAKRNKTKWKFVPSVTELKLAGVKFQKGYPRGNFLDIKFNNGVLEIPPLVIQDQTDSLLRNLIASEQCCGGQVTYMTSYAFFMDSLINSEEDVRLLRNQDIITNYLGDDEDVSMLFNKLCCEVTLANFYYHELCDQVNAYYKTRWHVWRATLKRNYFNSPWAILSFIAAVLLLLLTFASTLFASLSYIVHKS